MKKNSTQKNKGFTLLFAVIVSVLVLSVGASLITLAIKQVRLSGSARDSQFAFYASNTGIECAQYWDFHNEIGADIGDGFAFKPAGAGGYGDTDQVTCLGIKIIDPAKILDPAESNFTYASSGLISTSTFRIQFPDQEYCADVTVTKEINADDTIDTKIVSNGYNTCDPNNPRRIQRGLEINY